MLKRIIAILVGGCVLAVAGTAVADPFKVGLITPSPTADVGWSKQLVLGLEAVESHCGPNIETVIVEDVPTGPSVPRIINQMVAGGADFMILGSFGYMKSGFRIARRHPEIEFINASGALTSQNFGTFIARNYEGAYLAGLAAGMVTKSNIIGVIGAFPVPELVADINALTIAARKVNPDVEVKVVWLNSWFDPSKAQNAARGLVSLGADVLFSLNQDTPAVVTVAENLDVYVVNTASDMSEYAPNDLLVSITDDWSGYFVEQCQAARNGTFKGSVDHLGMEAGVVEMKAWNEDLTEGQMARIMQAEKAIKSGKLQIFAGPLKDKRGNLRVEAGKSLPDSKIFKMHWLLQGISGQIPD